MWAEVRRARDAGEPHNGATLATRFGKGSWWGRQRLAEFRRREGATAEDPHDAGLEDVWVELRRARDAGEPHTGATLAAKFGKSVTWGGQRLAEFRRSEGGTTQAQLAQQDWDAELAEWRRARDAGEPHTGATLAAKFGRGTSWGQRRIREFRIMEGIIVSPDAAKQQRGAELEQVWAELGRARDAGESYTGTTLGAKFGKGRKWGDRRLAEFRGRTGDNGPARVTTRQSRKNLEPVWAEVRRARDAGEPHTGVSLARAFGKSSSWGRARLAEFRTAEASGSALDASGPGDAAPAEDVSAARADVPGERSPVGEESAGVGGSSGVDAAPMDDTFDPLASESVRSLLAWAAEPLGGVEPWSVVPSSAAPLLDPRRATNDEIGWGETFDADTAVHALAETPSIGERGGRKRGADDSGDEGAARKAGGPRRLSWPRSPG